MEPLFQHQREQTPPTQQQPAPKGVWGKLKSVTIPRKTLKYVLYGLLATVAAVWAVIGLNAYWGAKTPQLLSQNTARLQTISTDVEQLPLPETIGYGKTSSSLPAVVTKYEAERQSIKSLRPVRFMLLNSYPSVNSKNNTTEKANASLDGIDQTLKTSSLALSMSAKLLQYDPEIDLQPYATGVETDASERLTRTDKGIQEVIAALKGSSVPYKEQLISQAQKLSGHAPNVTRQGVPAWSAKVHAVQQAMLQTIQENTAAPLQVEAAKLRALAGQYQN